MDSYDDETTDDGAELIERYTSVNDDNQRAFRSPAADDTSSRISEQHSNSERSALEKDFFVEVANHKDEDPRSSRSNIGTGGFSDCIQ